MRVLAWMWLGLLAVLFACGLAGLPVRQAMGSYFTLSAVVGASMPAWSAWDPDDLSDFELSAFWFGCACLFVCGVGMAW